MANSRILWHNKDAAFADTGGEASWPVGAALPDGYEQWIAYVNETEARLILHDVLTRYQRNEYHLLADAAQMSERIGGQVAGPESGTLYSIIIATEWVEDPHGSVRVTVVVHDNGCDTFGHVHGAFEKSPDDVVA